MNTKWTKGPWAVEENVHAGGITHLAVTARHEVNDWMPCSITPMRMAREVDYANARLIAAAPELVEALQSFLNISHRLPGCDNKDCFVCRENKAVIEGAKALLKHIEGGTK